MKGKLIIFSAPSGSGKTTIVRHLLSKFHQELAFSISATTRLPRGAEENGKDYYFLTKDEFAAKVADQQFVEWEEVYADVCYGTLRAEIERLWALGKTVLFDVDVKGGIKLKEAFGEQALSVFIKVSSEEEIARRLSGRGTDSAESLQKRMAKIRYESSFQDQFDVVIVNDVLEEALVVGEKLVTNFINQ